MDQLQSSHKFEGKRPFVTKLWWMDVKVYIVHKQRRLFWCIVQWSRMCTDGGNLRVKTVVDVTCGVLFAI